MSNTQTTPAFIGSLTIYGDEKPPQGDVVLVHARSDSATYVVCGQSYNGRTQLCSTHEREYERLYPQGWRYYPGDTCKHGKYVGGCGADIMCGACEMGDDAD